MVFLFAASGWAAEVPFAAGVDFNPTLIDAPAAIAWGDIDRDGDLDLASAALDSDDIEWWENVGGNATTWAHHLVDSAFGADTTAGLGAFAVQLADLNGDGFLDIIGGASGPTTGDLAAWLNDGTPADDLGGDGNSWTEVSIAGSALGVRSLAVGDLDSDGAPDVIAGVGSATSLSWWANDGSWTKRDLSCSVAGVSDVELVDLDRDGDLDVAATASLDDSLVWFENDGDPTDNTTATACDYWTRHTISSALTDVASVASADLDQDGDPDLAVAIRTAGLVGWFESDGTPADDTGGGLGNSWTAHVADATADGPVAVEVADLDSDGDPDLVATAIDTPEVVWYENSDGAATSWTRRVVDAANPVTPLSVKVPDLDGDGDLDLVIADNGADDLTWWENLSLHRSALFPVEEPLSDGFFAGRTLFVADLDRDGDLDLVGGSTPLWLDNTAGDGSAWVRRDIYASDGSVGMDAGDLDGDGDLDVASAEGDVQWHENDGSPADGGWTAHTLPAATGTVSGFPTDARVGDIDQDGDLDIIASYLSLTADDGLIAWWENDGTPGDGGWSEHDIDDTLTDPRAIRVGDLDGDGDLDVAGASQNGGQIWWWRNTSGGASWSSELSVSALIGPSGLDLGDFDRDGSLDVASSDAFGNVTVHRNTAGDGSTWSLATVRTGSEASAFTPKAADLDGDGDLDLAVANNPAGKAIWLENNGTLVNWPERSLSSTFSAASAAAAGDLDADGDVDLAVIGGNSVDGEIRLWLNHGGSFALATTDTAPGSIANGMADDLLKVEATHRGRSGDGDVELTSFELLLQDGSGTPLSDGEAGALFDGVDVYLDDGSESFDGADTLVGSEAPPFDLQSEGRLAVSFADDLAELRVELGTPRTYFVVADLSAGASGASPNTFQIRHDTEASSTGEDADHDTPLRLEYAENVTSGSVTSTGTACYLLTLGKVGNGSVPAANPTGSSGCSSGLYLAAESIQLTAAPLHSGYVVLAWAGTDNDASTSLMNSLSMPAASSAVTVTYGLADDLVLTADSYSSAALREACNSITAGTAVVVQTGGDVTYSAPAAILLTNGFEVQGGSFSAELATPAECP